MTEADNGHTGMTSEHNPLLAARLRKFQDDYLWCLNQVDFRERYGDQVVILHDRQVIGCGSSGAEARADATRWTAERGQPMPAESDLLILLVPPMVWLEEPVLSPAEAGPSPVAETGVKEGG